MHQHGHTELWRFLRNISTNICSLGECIDLKLGEASSLFIFNRITISWLYPLNGFWFIFLLRDSENNLLSLLSFKSFLQRAQFWKLGNIWTIVAIWRENMLGYMSADIICSEKRTVFQERSLRKAVSYEEQIMSNDKYSNMFSPQMEAIVFIILQIFFAMHAIFKIRKYSRIFPRFSWGIFGHMTSLDQSCASKKIWLIIRVS